MTDVMELVRQKERLEAKCAIYEKALEFYAESNGLCDNEEFLYISGEVALIAGKRARQALAEGARIGGEK